MNFRYVHVVHIIAKLALVEHQLYSITLTHKGVKHVALEKLTPHSTIFEIMTH